MEAIISPKERAELASLIGIADQYLYQCLRGLRDMEPERAVDAESRTNGRLKRWMLHRRWNRIWPDLVGAIGAPEVPAEESSEKVA
jgi:DNA-binding transcriptional regulator YdaS (Cro superfamily)